MSDRPIPRSLVLLERLLPDDGPLLGDLLEEVERGRSRAWLWWQVAGALATRAVGPPGDIRPLQLVEYQPVEAMVRTHRLRMQFRPVNLSASPISDVGGLGLLLLTMHVSVTVPGAWIALLAAMVGGAAFGLALAKVRARRLPPAGLRLSLRAS